MNSGKILLKCLLQKTLSGHKNIVTHLDSHIRVAPGKGDSGVHEVLLLTEFCPGKNGSYIVSYKNRLKFKHLDHIYCLFQK